MYSVVLLRAYVIIEAVGSRLVRSLVDTGRAAEALAAILAVLVVLLVVLVGAPSPSPSPAPVLSPTASPV
jgi:protein-S-isoprenylcysteine O-methyltransferase Ste14